MVNIGIIGLGGVGGYLAGRLVHYYAAGDDVRIYLYLRGESAAVVKERGVLLKSQGEEYHSSPYGVIEPGDVSPVMDYLFVATKNYSIDELQPVVAGAIDDRSVIIPLMNGVSGSERLTALFPQNRVWGGCVFIMSRKESAGVIVESGFKDNIFYYFGSKSASESELETLKAIFAPVSSCFHLTRDIEARVWNKFAYISTLSTIATYYCATNGEIFSNEERRQEYLALGEEFLAVAKAMGKPVREDIVSHNLQSALATPSTMTTSLQRDYYSSGLSELDSLSGYIVEKGVQYGVATPTYERMYSKLSSGEQ